MSFFIKLLIFVSRMNNISSKQYTPIAHILEMIRACGDLQKWPPFFTSLPCNLAVLCHPRPGTLTPSSWCWAQPCDWMWSTEWEQMRYKQKFEMSLYFKPVPLHFYHYMRRTHPGDLDPGKMIRGIPLWGKGGGGGGEKGEREGRGREPSKEKNSFH